MHLIGVTMNQAFNQLSKLCTLIWQRYRELFGLPDNLRGWSIRLLFIPFVLGPATYVVCAAITSMTGSFAISAEMIIIEGVLALFALFIKQYLALISFVFIVILFPLLVSPLLLVKVDPTTSWLSGIILLLVEIVIVVGYVLAIRWVMSFVQVGPYLREMWLPVLGLTGIYLGIVTWFGATFTFIYQLDAHAFTVSDQIGIPLWRFLYFSMEKILNASVNSGIKPASVLAQACTLFETLLGTLWLIVGLAAVVVYLTPRFNWMMEIAKHKSESDLIMQLIKDSEECAGRLSKFMDKTEGLLTRETVAEQEKKILHNVKDQAKHLSDMNQQIAKNLREAHGKVMESYRQSVSTTRAMHEESLLTIREQSRDLRSEVSKITAIEQDIEKSQSRTDGERNLWELSITQPPKEIGDLTKNEERLKKSTDNIDKYTLDISTKYEKINKTDNRPEEYSEMPKQMTQPLKRSA